MTETGLPPEAVGGLRPAEAGVLVDRGPRPAHIVALSDYGAHHASGTGVALLFHHLEERLGQLPVATTLLRSAEHMENWTRILLAASASGVFRHFHQPLTKILPIVWSADVGVVAADLLSEGATRHGSPRVVHVEGPRRYAVADCHLFYWF